MILEEKHKSLNMKSAMHKDILRKENTQHKGSAPHLPRPAWVEPTARPEKSLQWDVKNAPRILTTLQNSRNTQERLHAASMLRKCTEDPANHIELLKSTTFLQTILWVLSLPGPSMTSRRVQLQMMHCLKNITGKNEQTDVFLCHDEDILAAMWMLVTHANTETMELTILGMAVLGDFALRELNQPLLCHAEGFVNHYVDLLTSSTDGHVVFHALHTITGLSDNPRNHFVLARNKALLKVLVLILDSSTDDVERSKVGMRLLGNLLSFPENCSEVLRSVPDVLESLIRLANRDASCAAPRGKDLADEVARNALRLLELCQDFDSVTMDEIGFSRSSPATQREPIVDASYQEPESVVSVRETIPSPPAPAPVQLPTSSEELQAFIDKRIKSLEAMYGSSSQWTSGPAPSLPYRWV